MKNQWKAYLALSAMCIIWGTTYLAMRVGIMHVPPFFYLGIRQVIAGAILCLFFFSRGYALPQWKELRYQLLAGVLMIGIGNGLVGWGEQYVTSGIAALICSMMPIWLILFNVFFMGNTEKVNLQIVTGILLGFAGLVLIFGDGLKELANPAYAGGMIGILVATISWAAGTLLLKKQKAAIKPVFAAGIQLFSGGVFMLMVSPFSDNYQGMEFNREAITALVYLIVFGSIISYGSFAYALDKLPASTVSMYAYINPLVALLAGWIILDEIMSPSVVLAGLLTVGGVYLVTVGRRDKKRADLKHTSA
ncbi:MAG TPA: EamA family transporter [Anseongella sp.]|nr:EamA family transporter [Anseongella sp.]